jgi:hypothetical protein
MSKYEPLALYQVFTIAMYEDKPCYILTTDTYCKCCDRFREETLYSLKAQDGSIHHRVSESELSFLGEINE